MGDVEHDLSTGTWSNGFGLLYECSGGRLATRLETMDV